MSTFTRAHNVTTCDACHKVTRGDWRSLAEHTAGHALTDNEVAARRRALIRNIQSRRNQERRAS